ncbi:hypothetical protein [Bartonella tribocorum]|uniref:hypothetical protein n=1 Tax=Bartonella tribocorum TaxID=85701 RepID=UPI00130534C3|nr:hypothetical protein [Bartonella tribocorum]
MCESILGRWWAVLEAAKEGIRKHFGARCWGEVREVLRHIGTWFWRLLYCVFEGSESSHYGGKVAG